MSRFGNEFDTNLFYLICVLEVSSVRSGDEDTLYVASVKTVMVVTGKSVKLILILMASHPLG